MAETLSESHVEGLLHRLVGLGGILRNVKEAKTTIHNTEYLGGGDGDRPRLLVDIRAREALVNRRIGLVQEEILEAYRDALEHQPLIPSGTLRASSLKVGYLTPWSTGKPINISALKTGDVVDVKPPSYDAQLGDGVRSVTIERVDGLPSFRHEGQELAIVGDDEVYLVYRAEKQLPTDPGSFIEVTDYVGSIETPFQALLHADGNWRVSFGKPGASLLTGVSATSIRDFHELELTPKENA